MIETSPLINKAVEFMDKISSDLGKLNLDRLKKEKEYFESIYLKLIENLKELKKFKDEMEQRGFDSPYFALGMSRYSVPSEKQSYHREDVEDQRDIARYKMLFRANASFKKGTFERTKSAITSHNIAVGHIEEFISFECSCGKVTKGKEAMKVIEDKGKFQCQKCDSENVKLKENELGIFRLEILPYLPFGGEFTLEISKFTPTERMAYRELIEVLREKKRGRVKSSTVTFKTLESGKWVVKKEQVGAGKSRKLDYEGILRKKYGKIVIEHIRYHHERSILVSGRYNRQALGIAYTKILKKKRDGILNFLLARKVNLKKLKEYEELRREIESKMYVAQPTAFAIDTRIAEERKEIMEEFDEELKKAGLMNQHGALIPELDKAIEYRQQVRKGTLIKIPLAIFAWDIFRFLLIKPYRERRYASIFPGLQPIPEREHLKDVLDILKEEEITSAIRMFIDKNIISVVNPHEIVFKKFEIEEILQDYLKVTSSRAVGGVALYLNTELGLETSAKIVSAEIEELKEVLRVIIRLGRDDVIPREKLEGLEELKEIKISERAKEFLNLVR